MNEIILSLGVGYSVALSETDPLGERSLGPFLIPDTARTVRIEFARRTIANPDIWPDESVTLRWHVLQEEFLSTHYHGNSEAHGGVAHEEDGSESLCSWDETPLKPGTQRRVFVTYEFSAPVRTTVRVIAL